MYPNETPFSTSSDPSLKEMNAIKEINKRKKLDYEMLIAKTTYKKHQRTHNFFNNCNIIVLDSHLALEDRRPGHAHCLLLNAIPETIGLPQTSKKLLSENRK